MTYSTDWTIGIDLGDKKSFVYAMNSFTGEIVEAEIATTEAAFAEYFGSRPRCRVVFEVGSHSRWVKRVIGQLGFETLVADPRRIALITKNKRKNDRNDAMRLAELGCADQRSSRLELLNPVEHRDDELQADLSILKARACLVEMRKKLINMSRGMVKTTGNRLRSCSAPSFHLLVDELPAELGEALVPIFEQLSLLTKQIRAYDRTIERVQEEKYPEAAPLLQIRGVGPLTALAFILVLGDMKRFNRSRDVAAFLGLCPKQHESGSLSKTLGISKCGDRYMRQLLVQSAHYILGHFGEDCDLRRFGERLTKRGGKAAKKRAAVAVARKLAVVMHRLWVDQSDYKPFTKEPKTAA